MSRVWQRVCCGPASRQPRERHAQLAKWTAKMCNNAISCWLKSGMTIAPNQIFAHDNPLEPRPVKAALPDSRARTATNNTTKTCADETAGAKQSTSLRPQSCNAPLLRSQTAADCPCWAMVPCHHVAQACAWDEVAHRDTGGVEKSDSAASCKTCGILHARSQSSNIHASAIARLL